MIEILRQHTYRCEKTKAFCDALAAGEKRLLVTVGDSNTCNAHFSGGGKQWVELLHQELRDHYGTQKILLQNAGISGDTILDALARLDDDALRFRPDFAILSLGANDANRLSEDEFRAGTHEAISRLEDAGAVVVLRTVGPVMEYEPTPEHLWAADEKLRANNRIMKDIATERGLALADTHGQWWALAAAGELTVGELMHDAVHYNALGHQLVFRGIAPLFDLPGTFMWERQVESNETH